LVIAVVLQVPSVILVETLEAIVEIDRSRERRVERKSYPTWRISRVIRVVLARSTGLVVPQVHLLCIGGCLEQDETKGDTDGACVREVVLRMV
jgi:hypothetical protein